MSSKNLALRALHLKTGHSSTSILSTSSSIHLHSPQPARHLGIILPHICQYKATSQKGDLLGSKTISCQTPPATQGKGHVSTALLGFSTPTQCDHGMHFHGHLAPSRGPMWQLQSVIKDTGSFCFPPGFSEH